MSESAVIDFLYKTVAGRFFLKGLLNPAISDYAAKFLSTRASAFFIPVFIRKNAIDVEEYEVPGGGYRSFNDFFTRRIKPGRRVIGDGEIISPCDGLLTVSYIDKKSVFCIKNSFYSVRSLIRDDRIAKEYTGGTAFVFRLTPSNYHRYVFCSSGTLTCSRRIRGVLHSVKPICHEKYPVFVQNSREYTVFINTNLGNVIQMEVGALLVGKISNKPHSEGEEIYAGEEKGYFEYGGSSIVVLTKQRLKLSERISRRKKINGEIPIKMGEVIIRDI